MDASMSLSSPASRWLRAPRPRLPDPLDLQFELLDLCIIRPVPLDQLLLLDEELADQDCFPVLRRVCRHEGHQAVRVPAHLGDRMSDGPQFGAVAGQLPAHLELRLELDGLDHGLVSRLVPAREAARPEGVALLADDHVRVRAAELQVLVFQFLELLAQIVASLADERDHQAAVLLEGRPQELLIAGDQGRDQPVSLLPVARLVIDAEDLGHTIGTRDLDVENGLLDRVLVRPLRGQQRWEMLESHFLNRLLHDHGATDDHRVGRDIIIGPFHDPIRIAVGHIQGPASLLEDEQPGRRLVNPLGRGHIETRERQTDDCGYGDQAPSLPEDTDQASHLDRQFLRSRMSLVLSCRFWHWSCPLRGAARRLDLWADPSAARDGR